MAKQATVRFVDDLDGSEASGTFDFSLDGRNYQIDLSDENAAKLREALSPFIDAARKAGGRSGGRGRSQRQTPSSEKPARSSREETDGCPIIVQCSRTKTYIVTRWKTSSMPMLSSLAG